jgi:hypothetical protein
VEAHITFWRFFAAVWAIPFCVIFWIVFVWPFEILSGLFFPLAAIFLSRADANVYYGNWPIASWRRLGTNCSNIWSWVYDHDLDGAHPIDNTIPCGAVVGGFVVLVSCRRACVAESYRPSIHPTTARRP